MGVTLKTPQVAVATLTRVLYGSLFAQVDPLRLAEDERSERIVEEYRSLLQVRSGDLEGGVLQRLVADYSAHQFVIDRYEGRNGCSRTLRPLCWQNNCWFMHWVILQTVHSTNHSYCAILVAGRREKEETVDIKIQKRTRSIREIEIENMKKTSEYMRRQRESMRGIRQSRPKGEREPFGPESPEAIEAFLKRAFG